MNYCTVHNAISSPYPTNFIKMPMVPNYHLERYLKSWSFGNSLALSSKQNKYDLCKICGLKLITKMLILENILSP